jgi:hypothetical protein
MTANIASCIGAVTIEASPVTPLAKLEGELRSVGVLVEATRRNILPEAISRVAQSAFLRRLGSNVAILRWITVFHGGIPPGLLAPVGDGPTPHIFT